MTTCVLGNPLPDAVALVVACFAVCAVFGAHVVHSVLLFSTIALFRKFMLFILNQDFHSVLLHCLEGKVYTAPLSNYQLNTV